MNEKISSLLDGELSADEFAPTLKAMGSNELKVVERYQLIGALMRNECSSASIHVCRENVSERIARSVDAEPVWMLPDAKKHESMPAAPRRTGTFFGGFAAAAAIAAVAVLSLAPDWLEAPDAAEAPIAALDAVDRDALDSLLVEHGEFAGSAGLNGLISYAKFVSQGRE